MVTLAEVVTKIGVTLALKWNVILYPQNETRSSPLVHKAPTHLESSPWYLNTPPHALKLLPKMPTQNFLSPHHRHQKASVQVPTPTEPTPQA
jgi:hypothetical protein